MVSLIQLLEQSLIIEGRKEEVLLKYGGKITPSTVENFVNAQNQIDPKINNKYLDWMAKQYVSGKSENDIIDAITKWHKNIDKISPTVLANALVNYGDGGLSDRGGIETIENTPKDIKNYTFKQLKLVGDELEQTLSASELDKQLKGETRIIYDDPHYRILVPLSHKASCKYGSGTKWCVASRDTSTHFESETSSAILFFVIDKAKANWVSHPQYKVAVRMDRTNGRVTIWNAGDKNIGTDLEHFFPESMIQAMNRYRSKYVIDLAKLSTQIDQTFGMNDTGGEINGWQLSNDGTSPVLYTPDFLIKMATDLKQKRIALTLRNRITIPPQNIAKTNIIIPSNMIKNLEDIMVDENSNQEILNELYSGLIVLLQSSWDLLQTFFKPYMQQSDLHQMLERKINKVTGGWKFITHSTPSEGSRKSSFISVRTPSLDDNTKYTLVVELDYAKARYVFKAEEENGGQKEQYEDQITNFDVKLLENPTKLSKNFLDWVQEIVSNIYDEDSTNVEDGNGDNIQELVGKYTSPKHGNFTVELDNEKQMHVYSEKFGTHYLIKNLKVWNDNFMNKYQLQKIS